MSNSAKNAKSIGLSVAGILVALPADADLASITWVERAIQNQTPIPAGSVITGYASGSYGSYLLAGSTVGGPYSGVSISDIGSQMSPYIQGSQITGYQTWATQYPDALSDSIRSGYLHPMDKILAVPALGGSSFATVTLAQALGGSLMTNRLTNNIISQNGSTLGSYIGGYGSYSDTETGYMHILAGGSSASLGTGAPAKWLRMGRLGSAIGGYGSYASDATGTTYMYVLAGGSLDVRHGSAAKWLDIRKMGDHIGGYGQNAEDELQTHILAGDGGTGIPGWTTISGLGSIITPYINGGLITGYGSNANSGSMILAGDGGTAGWMSMDSLATTLGQQIGSKLSLSPANSGPYVAVATGGSGSIAGLRHASHLSQYISGTLIGTVNGSQVKIEQTATAAELQAKTGTIYFPVVQDGKIYGVTLNDFYILMNAQF